MLRLWTAGVGFVSQEGSDAALAVCVGTGGLAREALSADASGSLVASRVQDLGYSIVTKPPSSFSTSPLCPPGFTYLLIYLFTYLFIYL